MCLFHLNMNIEGRFCRHSVTSSETSSAWEIFFMQFAYGLSISDVKLELYWTGNFFFKSDEIFRSGRTFSSKVSSEGSYLNRIAMSTPAFWAFDRRSGSIIDGVIVIWKFGLFFDLVTSFHDLLHCQCYLLELLTHSIYGPILVIICQSVRELCLTKRTDKQTDKPTNEHSCQ